MSECDGNEPTFDIVEARAVFQPPMFWLKAETEVNVCARCNDRQTCAMCAEACQLSADMLQPKAQTCCSRKRRHAAAESADMQQPKAH